MKTREAEDLATDKHRWTQMMGQSNSNDAPNRELTEMVIGAAFEVSNELGVGFLEKVYENALVVAVRERGLNIKTQVPLQVTFHGVTVGDYAADLLIENRLLIEIKHAQSLNDAHLAQCLNYLKATQLKTCLLLNFGRARMEVKRVSL